VNNPFLKIDRALPRFFETKRSLSSRIIVSLLLSAGGLLLVTALNSKFGIYFQSVIILTSILITLYGELALGLLFTILLGLIVNYFFVPPIGSVVGSSEDTLRFLLLVAIELLLATMILSYRASLSRAVLAKQEAERAKQEAERAKQEAERAKQEAERAKQEAEKANQSKDLFLATLSHELRTPLTAILSWSQLLKSGRIDPSKTKTGLQAIEDSALSQNQLIGDLLDISRIASGKIGLDIQDVQLPDVTTKAIDAVRIAAEKKSIRLIEQLGTRAVLVSADSHRLKQIVLNLLTNAIKFTQPGGTVEIILGVQDDLSGPKAELSIRDTGKGIPATFLPHIFEQFSQADSSSVRVHGGLGIGLALVDKLVKLQGGTVEAQSDGEGKGATFTVRFPLSSAAQFAPDWYETPTVSSAAADDLSRRLDLTGVRILFVDDETSALHSIKEMLSSFGAQVRLASSAAEAIVEFEKAAPDLLVSDIAMPLEDGYSLIRKIRKLGFEKGGNTPAIALTAYADVQSRELALSAGYQAHLSKPVDSGELVRTILMARKSA